jgi:hypothetical protein
MQTVIARRSLLVLLWFGAVSALTGGVLGVFLNGAGVPLSYLQNTPFSSYLIPGLVLGIVIGGTQAVAAIAVQRRAPRALIAAAVAGFGMVVWIFVEIAVISEYSPLQTIYFALGVLELALVFALLGVLQPALIAGAKRQPSS